MNYVRIVPVPSEDGGLQAANGTKVFCGETQIPGITRIEIVAEIDGVWSARIDCVIEKPAELIAQLVGLSVLEEIKTAVMYAANMAYGGGDDSQGREFSALVDRLE